MPSTSPILMYLALAERVVHEEEGAGEDVPDQGLGAEPDGKPDDAGAGEQRRDVDAELRQDDHHGEQRDRDQDEVAEQRQQGGDPADPDQRALSDHGRVETALLLQALLDDDLDRLERDIADERHEADVPQAREDAAFRCEIDAPGDAEAAQREADQDEQCIACLARPSNVRRPVPVRAPALRPPPYLLGALVHGGVRGGGVRPIGHRCRFGAPPPRPEPRPLAGWGRPRACRTTSPAPPP